MNKQGYLLLVEDDPRIQTNNKKILEREGYSLKQALTLREARSVIAEEPPCAIVLDIQLPDGSGLDFLRELRKTSNVPVLMLTGMGTPQDIVKGLEAGGDDYLPKPYEFPVFLARVQTLLRRASIMPETLSIGPIRIDTASGKAYVGGEEMGLSQKEYALLQLFIQQPGEILSAEYLYEKAWGQKLAGDENALRMGVSRLRSKLADSGYTIASSRGEGYCFERE
ncbi:MAG: response regulator transcription factor [Oscillospiraceae bacterium]|jgi:DNA-binding response OmpR family regulator|nr:response regulator transcription factor [Oscillospiraceae bacterium]